MKNYIKLARVKHWIKNLLIFLPFFTSLNYSIASFSKLILAFFAFSLAASFVYVINDINDVEKDRKHPTKKHRPIASEKISVNNAIIFAIILIVFSFILCFIASGSIFNAAIISLISYLVINIFYSFGMKNIAILDVVLLASGFILRVYFGAFIIGVPVSGWLFLTVLNASLFLGLAKRKKELLIKENVRGVLKYYDEKFLNNFINICLSLVIVFYSLWTMEQQNEYLYFSIPLLIIIFMQYMLYIEKSEEGDPTTIIYQNKPLIFTILIYALFMFITMVVI